MENAEKIDIQIEQPSNDIVTEINVSDLFKPQQDTVNTKEESTIQQSPSHEPPATHPRYKEVYGKWKQAERDKEQLFREQQEIKQKMDQILEMQQKTSIDNTRRQIEAEYKAALDSGDNEKAAKLYSQHVEMYAKGTGQQPQQPVYQQNNLQQPQAQQYSQQAQFRNPEDIVAESLFMQQNEWLGKDKMSTALFKGLAIEVGQDPDYREAPLREKLGETIRRMKEVNPKFNRAMNPTAMPVTSGYTSSNQPKTVSLNEQEKRMALRLFSDKSEIEAMNLYAKGKLIQGGN
jgi:hypothetical protein